MTRSFRDLRVWQEAMLLTEHVYRITEEFPRREHYGLSSQLRRAALSIPSNIAEGQGRLTSGEWLNFLGIARGSMYEVETQLEMAARLGYVSPTAVDALIVEADDVGRALAGLIKHVTLRANRRKPRTTNNE